jgi:lipopolysaccharide biosynthesis glycosyltransferase
MRKKILVIAAVVLLLVVIFEIIRLERKVSSLKHSTKALTSLNYKQEQQSLRQNHLLEFLQKNSFNTVKPGISHNSLPEHKKELLFRLAEDSYSSIPERTEAYRRLALYNYNSGSFVEKWSSIMHISAALDLEYSEENINLLANLLHLPNKSNLLLQLGNQIQELSLLKSMLNNNSTSDEQEILLGARMFWILKRGRASEIDIVSPPNFKEALKVKRRSMKKIPITKSNESNILLIIDDKYAGHATVTVSSILLNASPDAKYNFYFLMNKAEPVSASNIQKIKSLGHMHNATFNFLEFPEELIDQQPSSIKNKVNAINERYEQAKNNDNQSKWPSLIAYRLYIDKALPQIDKILYLDADIIINTDLHRLFSMDIDNYYLAAAVDFPFFSEKAASLSDCSKQKMFFYFNSGVLLLNLRKMRSENFYAQVSHFLDNNKKCELTFFDQDALNILVNNKVYKLSNTWNYPEGLNYRSEFLTGNELIYPNIHHMYFNPAKKDVTKPWKQKNAQQLWKEGKFNEIHKIFWSYWAYRDLVQEILKSTPYSNL